MSDNTKMREAFVQACKEYGPTISFGDFECGWDACMAWQAARTVPEASSSIFASRCPMCSYQHGHQIGCENNPIDIALRASAAAPKKEPKK